MGKKDSTGLKAAPVDQYRKQIGKQDYKKSKKEVKSQKQRAEKKNSAIGIQEVVLILISFLSLMAAVYMFLFWQLSGKDSK